MNRRELIEMAKNDLDEIIEDIQNAQARLQDLIETKNKIGLEIQHLERELKKESN